MPTPLTARFLGALTTLAGRRVTANPKLQISGVTPGGTYQVSTDFGKTWNQAQSAPLAKSAALQLDGQNDFVAIPDSSSLPSGNGSYTLEAWIKPEAMGDRGIIGWGPWGSNSQVNALRLMGNGQIRHYWWSNDLDVNVGNLADGKWHHVAATFDGTTRKVYVDGVLKGSDAPPTHRMPTVAKNIRIGSTNNGEFFKGSIDDAAIWGRALSQQEISQRQTTGPNVNDKDLLVLYSFDEGSGNTAAAVGSAKSGMSGTLTNGPTWTSRDLATSNTATGVDVVVNISDGQYSNDQIQVRDLSSQQILKLEAFQVDTQAPTIQLNIPGGTDKIISSQVNDNVITGTAEAGRPLTLLSKLGTVAAGNLKITADNGADIYLNGQLVGSTSDWTKPYDFTGLKINAGQNVLAVLAYDVGGIAGLSGRFDVPSGAFGTSDLTGWKVLNVDPDSTTDNSAASRDRKTWNLPADWTSVNFDDRGWSSAINVREKTGQYPWGNRTGDPAWIWSSDPYNHDAVLFRYTFNGTSNDIGQVVLADNIEVNADGNFSYQLTVDQVKQLGEGAGKTLVAQQTDAAGNTGRSSQVIFAIDTVADPVSITSIGGGDGKVSSEVVETGKGPLKLQVDQYTGYWSSKLADLQNYVKNFNPASQKNRYTVVTDVIDFTDDKGGFAGELPFDRRWPAAEATNYWGTGGVNNQFFARISGDFYLDQPGQYRFRTFNDDGVFLLIDGKLVINDPTLHPEQVYTGDANLAVGNHQLELFFFENGGEASLEFSVSRFDPVKKTWGAYQLMGKDPAFLSKSVQEPDNLVLGKAAPNSRVFFRIGDQEIGSADTDDTGNYRYGLTTANLALLAKVSGNAALVAYQRDAAGNLSTSAPGAVALKQKPPVVTIDGVGLLDKTVSTLNGDREITGKGESNLLTTLRVGEIVLGQAQADSDGRFRYTLTTDNIAAIGQGANKSIVASQSLSSGLSGSSTPFVFAVDTVAPNVSITSVGYGDTRMSRNSVELGKGPLEFKIDQYTGYWSKNLVDLQSYITKYNPATQNTRYSVVSSVIDYTDDPKGFAGELAYDMRWPAAVATNAYGTSGINNQFFVRVATDFNVEKDGSYRFRTYNDDGVFLLVDGKLIINDPTEHPEAIFTGDVKLDGGAHKLELFFFENGGEASLEFSVSYLDPATNKWGSYQLVGQQAQLKAASNLQPDNLIEGTADPLGDVIVYLDTVELGRVRANQQGQFALNLSVKALELLDNATRIGQPKIYAVQLDAAGNVGNSGPTIASVKLTPPIITLDPIGGVDRVVSSQSADRIISGTAEAGIELNLSFNGQVFATIDSVGSDGRFRYSLTDADIAVIGQGLSKTLLLHQQDLYGNVGTLTSPLFDVDTIPPALLLPPTKDSNALGGVDGIVSTQLGDAVIVGRGEANTPVMINFADTINRTLKTDEQGRFTYALNDPDIAALGQGTAKKISISQSDLAGNKSIETLSVDVDTIPPDKPVIQNLAGDGYVSSLPNDNVLNGSADPNTPITLLFNGSVLATVNSASNGEFSYALTSANLQKLGQGTFKFQARLSDFAGNVSTSDPLDLVIDTIAPERPSIVSVGGDDLTISTKDNKVVGKAEAKSVVRVYFGNKLLGSTTANDFGDFEYSITGPNVNVIGQGTGKNIVITAADVAGNVSAASEPFGFSVDTVAPGSPTIRSIGGSDGVISSQIGDSAITGLGEAGTVVQIRATDVNGRIFEVSGITVDTRGAWSYTLTSQQAGLLNASLLAGGAPQLMALSSDKAGNEGQSISIVPKIDLLAPDLINLQLGGADRVVSSQLGDNNIVGKGDASRAVTLSLAGRTLATVMADSSGKFSYALTSADLISIGQGVNKQLEITQSDAAGNSSRAALSFAVDTIAPTVATLNTIGGFDKIVTSSASDRVVSGKAEAGSTIVLRSIAGTLRNPLATIIVDQTGTFQHVLTSQNLASIAQGVGKAIEVLSTDAAGNQSLSKPVSFQVEAQWQIGTNANDVLSFASGIDTITGLSGADRFVMPSLASGLVTGSSICSFDRLLDFQIGVDQIDGPTAVAARNVTNLGRIFSLSNASLSSLLNTSTFSANSAAIFTYNDSTDGLRTFLAMNDRQSGFNQATDAVVEITGYTGILSQLSIV